MSAILLLIALFAAAKIEANEICNRKLDLTIAVDGSASLCGGPEPCDKWYAILEFCKNIVSSLTIGADDTRVAFVTYANATNLHWNLQGYTDKTSLLSAIGNIKYPGGELIDLVSISKIITGIYNPLVGDRVLLPTVQNVGIVITDGAPNYPDFVYALESFVVQLDLVEVFLVCLTPGCTEHCARGMSSPPHKINEEYWLVDDALKIDQIRDVVVRRLCAFEYQFPDILHLVDSVLGK